VAVMVEVPSAGTLVGLRVRITLDGPSGANPTVVATEAGPGASGGAARVSLAVKENAARSTKAAISSRAAVARVDRSKTDFVFTGHLPCRQAVYCMEAQKCQPDALKKRSKVGTD